eukprot:COSAG02_NODE_2565_length_8514_cov_174.016502_5_plen_197_part_00
MVYVEIMDVALHCAFPERFRASHPALPSSEELKKLYRSYRALDKQYRVVLHKHTKTVAELEMDDLDPARQDELVAEAAKGSTRSEELKKIRYYKMSLIYQHSPCRKCCLVIWRALIVAISIAFLSFTCCSFCNLLDGVPLRYARAPARHDDDASDIGHKALMPNVKMKHMKPVERMKQVDRVNLLGSKRNLQQSLT